MLARRAKNIPACAFYPIQNTTRRRRSFRISSIYSLYLTGRDGTCLACKARGKQHESIHPRLVTSRGDHPCPRRGTWEKPGWELARTLLAGGCRFDRAIRSAILKLEAVRGNASGCLIS